MKEALIKLQEKSYSPYSNYKVASIVEMMDGKTFCGVNIENASYGATICAERVAIYNAISNGYKRGDFKCLYVMVDNNNLGTPCMLCRQVISEFFLDDAKIICINQTGKEKEYLVRDLCPFPFSEDDLL